MKDINTNVDDDIDEKEEKDEAKRSLYPSKSLKEMVDFVTVIYNKLGHTSFHSKHSIAEAHGLAYPTIKPYLSSGKYLGLLEIQYKAGYKVSPLFLKLYRPVDDRERAESAIIALNNFPLFNTWINQYSGQLLPPIDGLSNMLERDGYSAKAARTVSGSFIKSLTEYRLLGSKNVLTVTATPLMEQNQEPQTSSPTAESVSQNNPQSIGMDDTIHEILVPLREGRKAFIQIPKDFDDRDLRRIAKFVGALETEDLDK